MVGSRRGRGVQWLKCHSRNLTDEKCIDKTVDILKFGCRQNHFISTFFLKLCMIANTIGSYEGIDEMKK